MLRDIIKPTVVLLVICVVVAAALGFTYSITKEPIAERIRIDAENAKKEVFAHADTFKEIANLEAFTSADESFKLVREAFVAQKGGQNTGYVFAVASSGYGGEMLLTVGVGIDGRITGVKIGDNKETPGLGSKAADKPFLLQYFDLQPQQPLEVVKAKKSKPEEIEAISGATITSRAVTQGVQAAVDLAAELSKRGSEIQ